MFYQSIVPSHIGQVHQDVAANYTNKQTLRVNVHTRKIFEPVHPVRHRSTIHSKHRYAQPNDPGIFFLDKACKIPADEPVFYDHEKMVYPAKVNLRIIKKISNQFLEQSNSEQQTQGSV